MSRYFITSIVFLSLVLFSFALDGILPVPTIWYITLLAVFVIITGIGAAVLSMQFFLPVKMRGRSGQIALTFDDGPVPGKTDRLLDILKKENVSASFFCIGNKVEQNIELGLRIHNEGHLLANHTYWHGRFFDLKSTTGMLEELVRTDAAITKLTGKRPRFFRPPYGVTNPMLANAVKRRNYSVIGWTIRSFDTVITDRERLLSRVVRQVNDGGIVLFHDHSETMLEILPDFIRFLRQKGFAMVRVDELIDEKAYG